MNGQECWAAAPFSLELLVLPFCAGSSLPQVMNGPGLWNLAVGALEGRTGDEVVQDEWDTEGRLDWVDWTGQDGCSKWQYQRTA